LAETFTYPVIVKPRYTFDTSFPGKNATISSGADLIAFFEKNDILENAVIQEVIPSGDGDILVIASYSDFNGTVMAMYSGRKIRQHLPDYGATCFGISETYPDLRERTRLFLEAISYRGFAMTEFARSRVDGQAYFLELNTRTSWTNQLYSDAGIDLTQIAYRDILGNTRDLEVQNPAQIDNVVWLDFRRDVSSMLLKRKTGQITVLGWLRSLAQATSFAHWDWRDPIPFLAACGWRIRNTVGRLVELAVDKPTWKSRK
jgi:predicted ATP-grasp superfamily ATP-dependent carboligase